MVSPTCQSALVAVELAVVRAWGAGDGGGDGEGVGEVELLQQLGDVLALVEHADVSAHRYVDAQVVLNVSFNGKFKRSRQVAKDAFSQARVVGEEAHVVDVDPAHQPARAGV